VGPPPSANPGGGTGDFTYDLSDIRDDASYFADLMPQAAELVHCWNSVSTLVKHWGLWAGGSGSYVSASRQFADLYTGAAKEMSAIAQGLQQTAADYQAQEAENAQIARTVPNGG